jgi:hypothetical protein
MGTVQTQVFTLAVAWMPFLWVHRLPPSFSFSTWASAQVVFAGHPATVPSTLLPFPFKILQDHFCIGW